MATTPHFEYTADAARAAMFEQFKRTHAEQYRDVFTRIRNAAEAGWDEVVVPYKLHSELYDALGDAGYKLFYGNIKEDGEFRATLNERGKSSVCKITWRRPSL